VLNAARTTITSVSANDSSNYSRYAMSAQAIRSGQRVNFRPIVCGSYGLVGLAPQWAFDSSAYFDNSASNVYMRDGRIFSGGANVATVATWTNGDLVSLTISGTSVTFYKNGTAMHTASLSMGGDLYAVCGSGTTENITMQLELW
jgi:hypothetical protein